MQLGLITALVCFGATARARPHCCPFLPSGVPPGTHTEMEGGWWANLTACWDVVSASVSPTLGQLGSWGGCWPYFGLGQQQELLVNGRRFRVAKLLGEGG